MKKSLVGFLVMGSLGVFLGTAQAATTADLLITVTPNGTKSLTLSTGTLALGPLSLASVNNVSSSVTVTNDGDVPSILGLRVKTDDGIWSSSDTVGTNRYVLRALFNSSLPDSTDFQANDNVLTGSVVPSTGLGAVYSGNENGSVFNPADTRGLWFNMRMPTASTTAAERSFTVEVSAN